MDGAAGTNESGPQEVEAIKRLARARALILPPPPAERQVSDPALHLPTCTVGWVVAFHSFSNDNRQITG
eukprot:4914889-Pyramimonas_sp.AAC.1